MVGCRPTREEADVAVAGTVLGMDGSCSTRSPCGTRSGVARRPMSARGSR